MKKFLDKFWPLVFILIISLPAIFYLTKPGFFPMHDDTQVARVEQMAKSLKEGQFPVRWVADLGYGYGYPLFNFYNPLPYYVGAFFNIIGFDPLLSTKLMFAIGFFLAPIGMYFLAKNYFGKIGGILAAVFYMYAPYHAVQMYVRGSVAEFWAYGILSFIFLGVAKKNFIMGGISLSLLILSHNLTAIMIMPILLVFMFIIFFKSQKSEKKSWLYTCIAMLLIGLGLSCFFWLPSLGEKNYTAVDQMVKEKFNPLLHFVYPEQLWNSQWGFGGSAPGKLDGMSFQIGKWHILLSLVSVLSLIWLFRKDKKRAEIILLSAGFLIIVVFMMLPISELVWQTFSPLLSYLQFPWRFLTLSVFIVSFLSGSTILLVEQLFHKKKKLIYLYSFLAIGFLLFLNTKYFAPQYIYDVHAQDLVTKEKLNWENSLVSDEYLPTGFPKPKNKNELPGNKFNFESLGEIELQKSNSVFYNLKTKTTGNNKLTANIAYFPGWKAFMDGKAIPIISSNYLIALEIPAGEHNVVVKFTNTPIRKVANIVSLLSLLCLARFVFLNKKND